LHDRYVALRREAIPAQDIARELVGEGAVGRDTGARALEVGPTLELRLRQPGEIGLIEAGMEILTGWPALTRLMRPSKDCSETSIELPASAWLTSESPRKLISSISSPCGFQVRAAAM
jgi:hypothetical protein